MIILVRYCRGWFIGVLDYALTSASPPLSRVILYYDEDTNLHIEEVPEEFGMADIAG